MVEAGRCKVLVASSVKLVMAATVEEESDAFLPAVVAEPDDGAAVA